MVYWEVIRRCLTSTLQTTSRAHRSGFKEEAKSCDQLWMVELEQSGNYGQHFVVGLLTRAQQGYAALELDVHMLLVDHSEVDLHACSVRVP